jgi:serine/threonine-protein kinase
MAYSGIDPRYEELGIIDRGAIGIVRLVRDAKLLREVAIKTLRPELADDPSCVEQLIGEAQITSQMDHPNIIPVYELGIDAEGKPYFAMKAVRGPTLHRWLADARRPVGSAERLSEGLDVFQKVCGAISFAHSRGVIHRDLKPANIMVGGLGQVYVIDWGLARLVRRDASGTALAHDRLFKSSPVGTVAYMSPEAALGEGSTCDKRTDVFGLGAILYEILTGTAPYSGGSSIATKWQRARAGEYTPIDRVLGGVAVSEELRRIVYKALARKRERRFQTAAELKSHVQRFLRG